MIKAIKIKLYPQRTRVDVMENSQPRKGHLECWSWLLSKTNTKKEIASPQLRLGR